MTESKYPDQRILLHSETEHLSTPLTSVVQNSHTRKSSRVKPTMIGPLGDTIKEQNSMSPEPMFKCPVCQKGGVSRIRLHVERNSRGNDLSSIKRSGR